MTVYEKPSKKKKEKKVEKRTKKLKTKRVLDHPVRLLRLASWRRDRDSSIERYIWTLVGYEVRKINGKRIEQRVSGIEDEQKKKKKIR